MMKKITLLFLFLLTTSFGYSQILETFDPAPAVGVWISNPGEPMTTVEVVDATVDFATYGKVGRMVTDATSVPWQNAILTMTAFKIDITTTKTITADVYYVGGAIDILGKLAGGVEVNGAHPGTGWSLVTWDFTGLTGEYNTISFFPLRDGTGWIGTGGSTDVREVWIDNISAPAGNAIAAEITDEAPIPTNDSADVISVYSDTYTSNYTVLNPGWGQSTSMSEIQINTNNTLKYANLNYQGIEYASSNVSTMEYVHLDYYTEDATALEFFLIAGGENAYNIAANEGITTGQWVGIDIELSTAYPDRDLTEAFQFKTVGNGTIYLDNLYFWKAPTDPLTDATLSDLQVDGATISDFGSGTTDYDYALSPGTTVIPQITTATPTNTNVTSVTMNQATVLPGDATVVVLSEDGTVTETYTISFIFEGPATAAPTPPARDAANVISFYSDAYTDTTIDDFDFGLCGASPAVAEVMIAGNATQQWLGQGCQGISIETNRINASTFTNLHFDFFTDDAIDGAVFNLKLVDWAGNATDAGSTGLEVVFNAGTSTKLIGNEWVSVDVDITSLGGMVLGNLERGDIAQIHISSNLPNAWYDNLYLYKEVYVPGTCSDGIMNQDETGIDCGGTISGCAPCSGLPTVAAPTPPARAAADVISFYSDAYTDTTIDDFDFGLCDGGVPNLAVSEVMIAGNPTQNYLKPGCQGVDIQLNRIDASTFTNLHFDFFTDDAIDGAVFNLKLVDWAGNATDAGSTGLEVVFNAGTSTKLIGNEWVSVDVDITSLGGMVLGNLERGDIAQIHISSNLPNAWYDNLYLHKDTTLGINNFEIEGLTAYPNPTNNHWVISTKDQIINSIEVFNVLGKRVLSVQPNALSAKVDASSLSPGMYISTITTELGTTSRKLIKN